MTVKDHAEHVEGFALVPVRCFPNAGHGRDVRVFLVKQYFQSDAMVFSRREKVVIHFETRLLFNAAIRTTDISKKVETCVWRRLQKFASLDNAFARHDDRRLAESEDYFAHPFR